MYLEVKETDLNSNQSNFPILRDKTLLLIYKCVIKYVIENFG